MNDFFGMRDEVVRILTAGGEHVAEPDTVWGTGIANVPAIQGIASCYRLGEQFQFSYSYELGEKPNRRYFATKYMDELCERIFDLHDGGDDIGSVDELGWYGKMKLGWEDLIRLGWIFFAPEFGTTDLPIGVIIQSNDQGFCYYSLFFNEREFTGAWEQLEISYSDYWAKQEEAENEAIRASESATEEWFDNGGRSNYQ
jgi:hypothetical protein